MEREKIKLLVEVELDPVTGAFSTAESATLIVQQILDRAIRHYNPVVLHLVD